MRKPKSLRFNRIMPVIITGLVIAVIDIFFEISLATLLFSGPLSGFIPTGIGMLLFGAMVLNFIVSLTSSVPGMIAVPQDSAIAILAVITGSITRAMAGNSTDEIFATNLAVIIFTTILTGFFFLALGYLKLSKLVRFVPYPVIGGFLAGTGWLIFEGGIKVLLGYSPTAPSLDSLTEPDILLMLLPALILAVIILIASRRSRSPLTIPAIMIAAIGLFYLWLLLSGTSLAEAESRNLLLSTGHQGASWTPKLFTSLFIADWSIIMDNILQIGSVLIVSVLSMLFITSGIETTIRKDINFDRELQSAGAANLLAGLGGSPVGHHSLSFSTLTYHLNTSNRLVGIVTAICIGAVLFFGVSYIGYIPVIVVGGILLFLGLTFLVEWLYDGRKTLPLIDYALMVLILLIIAGFGFLEGVAVGMGIAVVLFVYNYSKLEIVRHKLSGDTYHSSVMRTDIQRAYLREHGNQILVLELQGFLFFGTAYNLQSSIKKRMTATDKAHLRCLVLDFRLVNGVDASAAFILNRIRQYTRTQGVELIISDTSAHIMKLLERAGFPPCDQQDLHYVHSLDHAVEISENNLIREADLEDTTTIIDFRKRLSNIFSSSADVEKFIGYLVMRDLKQGDYLLHKGDPSDHLYFVESGLLSVELLSTSKKETRVTTIQGGAIVGEIGLYLSANRTASVWASKSSRLYQLSRESFDKMEKENPELASALHRWTAEILAGRLSDNIKTLEELLE